MRSPTVPRRPRPPALLRRDSSDSVKSTEKELSDEEWKALLDGCALTDSGAPPAATINALKRFTRVGLPGPLRRRAWCAITGADAMVQKKEGVYQAFVKTATRLMEDEREEQVLLRIIERDLRRTLPCHVLFWDRGDKPSDGSADDGNPAEESMSEGLVSLRHVLYAYSIYDNEVGYCQGMNFIAAMLLTFLSEEESFWMLVAVMNEERYGMRGLFAKDMSGVHEALYVAEKVIQKFLPKLHRHLESQHVEISMFVTQWILTMFTSTFPFDLVSRVWDSYIVEGWKVVYRVMLSLLAHAQNDLLGLEMERILFYMKDDFPSKIDGQSIFQASLKIPLRQKHVRKFRTEWRLVKSGEGEIQRTVRGGSVASMDSNASSRISVPNFRRLPGFGVLATN